MSVKRIECSVTRFGTVRTVTAKAPTKSRVEALLIDRSPYYSIKLVIGLGIALTTCGIILCLFGVVLALVEVETTLMSVYCETSIGVWVILNGFIHIISGSRPNSSCQLYVHMLSSLVTIGVTGALSILIANSVLHYSELENVYNNYTNNKIKNLDLLYNPPILLINSLLLTFSVLSFIISIISFCISSHKVCQCYSHHKFGHNYLNNNCNLDPDLKSKRDRILQWIVQQSDLQLNQSNKVSDYDTMSYISKKKLSHLNSTATDSTRLSAYDH